MFKWKMHWLLKVENRWCIGYGWNVYGKVYSEKCMAFSEVFG